MTPVFKHMTEFILNGGIPVLVVMPDTTDEDPPPTCRPLVTMEVQGPEIEILIPTMANQKAPLMQALSMTDGITFQLIDDGLRGTILTGEVQQHLGTIAHVMDEQFSAARKVSAA